MEAPVPECIPDGNDPAEDAHERREPDDGYAEEPEGPGGHQYPRGDPGESHGVPADGTAEHCGPVGVEGRADHLVGQPRVSDEPRARAGDRLAPGDERP